MNGSRPEEAARSPLLKFGTRNCGFKVHFILEGIGLSVFYHTDLRAVAFLTAHQYNHLTRRYMNHPVPVTLYRRLDDISPLASSYKSQHVCR